MVVKVQTLFCQVVAHARRPLLVGSLLKQPQSHQRLEPLCKGVARDAQARLPVIKALHANKRTQNQRDRPAVTQHMEAVAKCAGGQSLAGQVKVML